jgi:hypothetical protein
MSIILPALFFSVSSLAEEIITPDANLAPERVVQIQLEALQRNDSQGIAQTWAFAHPVNKKVTGPLERFESMIKSPNYRMLLGHQKHTIKSVLKTIDHALFVVKVFITADQHVTYKWELLKVNTGPAAGAWTTIGVSAPLLAKDAI